LPLSLPENNWKDKQGGSEEILILTFIVDLLALGKSLVSGVRNEPEFRAIVVLIILILGGGTAFYSLVEGWRVVDALYFCVMTVATVGYGDFAPSGTLWKLFTICFAILGIGLFASFVGKLVAIRIQSHARVKARLHHADSE
jgi:voltage-gated potassium channel